MNDSAPLPDDDLPSSAGLEAWLRDHRRRIIACLIGGALFVRLLLCLQVAGGPIPRLHEVVTDGDGHFFDVWARHLAAEDWLQREPLHPMTGWMKQVADAALDADPGLPVSLGLAPDRGYDRAAMREALWTHWMRGRTYYQEPAYVYLVALTYRLTGPGAWHVFAWQLALGVLSVLIVHGLTRRLFSETAAAAAGALAVLAPIPLCYEVTLLRDGTIAFVTLALALAMHWAANGPRRRWLALGVAFGLAATLKQTFLLFPLVLGVWRWASIPARLRGRLGAAGAVAAGVALGLLPVIARNLAVGAPPLGLSGSGAMVPAYHTVSATPFDLMVGPELARVLVASDGGVSSSVLPSARTFPSPWGLPLLSLQKLLYTWHGYEAPNNVDFYVMRQAAPVLAALPVSFVVLAVLAGVGVATRRALRAWPLLVVLVASLPAQVLAAVFSRYRAPLCLALVPLAGAGLVRLCQWLLRLRWRPLLAAGTLGATYAAWATSGPPGHEPLTRARQYAWTGASAAATAEPAFAALYFQESLRLAPGRPRVEAALGEALLASNEPGAALPHLEAALRRLDEQPLRVLRIRALAGAGKRAEALAAAREAGARELVEAIERMSEGDGTNSAGNRSRGP